jgi:16S rRNA A1518/A1519 N6-dimethyltransferase RsmA/KsgA/DIM1 with predicted DNA glycosylase/AP lyase activity
MVRAKRSLGQNFLMDPGIQRRIVDALEAGPEDEVLEIVGQFGEIEAQRIGV